MTPPVSAADDFPVHQIAEPIRRVGTSDRNFYDRYYFNFHAGAEQPVGAVGFGVYPNLGVADGFLLVDHDSRHRVVRASRELGTDRMDLSVGPLTIEVVEPLETLRVTCGPNDWGIELDATWRTTFPAHLEPQHLVRSRERVTTRTCRFIQWGRWSGTLRVEGTEHDLGALGYFGGRDRSWGVRPVGEPEPRSGRSGGRGTKRGYQVHWSPLQFEDCAIHYFVQEDGAGHRIVESAVRVWPRGSGRDSDDLGRPEHDLDFDANGTLRGGRVHFPQAPGGSFGVTFEAHRPLHLVVGTGYSGEDGWRHGKWQGTHVVDGVVHDHSTPEGKARMTGLVDAVSTFRRSDGAVGHGMFEYLVQPPAPEASPGG